MFEERVPVVLSGLGDPRTILRDVRVAGSRFVAVVGSVAAARKAADAGADAVVVQGNEAGGHVGPLGTLTLGQTAVHAVDVPVLLAGGIASPEAVRAGSPSVRRVSRSARASLPATSRMHILRSSRR